MHTAPAVDYPVGRSAFPAILLLLLWAGVVVVYTLWIVLAPEFGWRQLLGLGVALAAAAVVLRLWRLSAAGTVSWDGQAWWWESNGVRAGGEVAPTLDLQFAVLLLFDIQDGSRCWLWLESRAAPSRWRALRRAIFAHGRVPGSQGTGGSGRHAQVRDRSTTP